ncbi:hypothetical protein RCL1_001755 [Eukaryota sp. TZLM3-RCL]
MSSKRRIDEPAVLQTKVFNTLGRFAGLTQPHAVVLTLCYLFTALQWVGFSTSFVFKPHASLSAVANLFTVFHLYPLVLSSTTSIISFLVVSTLIASFFITGLVLMFRDGTNYSHISIFSRYLAPFHYTLLFIPLVGGGIFPLSQNILSSTSYPVTLVIVSLFLSIVHSLLALVFVLTCFDQNLRSVKVFSLISSRANFYCLLFRFLCLIMSLLPVFLNFRSAFFISLLSLYLPFYYCFTQPFIHFNTNRTIFLFYSIGFPFLITAFTRMPIYFVPIFYTIQIILLFLLKKYRLSTNWLALSNEAYLSSSPVEPSPAAVFISEWKPRFGSDVSIAVRSLFTTSPANALFSWQILFQNSRKHLPSDPLPIYLHSAVLLAFPHDHLSALQVAKPLLKYAPFDLRYQANRLVELCMKFGRGLQAASAGSAADLRVAAKCLEDTRSKVQSVFSSLIDLHLAPSDLQDSKLAAVMTSAAAMAEQSTVTDEAFIKAIDKFPNDRDLLAEYAKFLDDILADEVRADMIWEKLDDLNDELAAQKEHDKIKGKRRKGTTSDGHSDSDGTGKSGTNTGTPSEDDKIVDDEYKLAHLLGIHTVPVVSVSKQLTTLHEDDGNQSDYQSETINQSFSGSMGKVVSSQLSPPSSPRGQSPQPTPISFERKPRFSVDSTPLSTPRVSFSSPLPSHSSFGTSLQSIYSADGNTRILSKKDLEKLRRSAGDTSLRITDLLSHNIDPSSSSPSKTTIIIKDSNTEDASPSKVNPPSRLVVKRKQHVQAQVVKEQQKLQQAGISTGNTFTTQTVAKKSAKLEDAISRALTTSSKKQTSHIAPGAIRFREGSNSEDSVVEVDSVSESESVNQSISRKQLTSTSSSSNKTPTQSSSNQSNSNQSKSIPEVVFTSSRSRRLSDSSSDSAFIHPVPPPKSSSDHSSGDDTERSGEVNPSTTSENQTQSGGSTTLSNSIKFSTSMDSKPHYEESIGSTLSSNQAPRGWSHVDVKSVTMGTTADIPDELRSQSTHYRNQRKKRRKKLHRGRASLRANSAFRRISRVTLTVVLTSILVCISMYILHISHTGQVVDAVIASVFPHMIATSSTALARSARHVVAESTTLANRFNVETILEMSSNDLTELSLLFHLQELGGRIGKKRNNFLHSLSSSVSLFISHSLTNFINPTLSFVPSSTLARRLVDQAKDVLTQMDDQSDTSSALSHLSTNSLSFHARALIDSLKIHTHSFVLSSLSLLLLVIFASISVIFFLWSHYLVLTPALNSASQDMARWLHLLLLLPGEALYLLAGVEQRVSIKPEPEVVADSSESSKVSTPRLYPAPVLSSFSVPEMSLPNLPAAVPTVVSSDGSTVKGSTAVKSLSAFFLILAFIGLTVLFVIVLIIPGKIKIVLGADVALHGATDTSSLWKSLELIKIDSAFAYSGQNINGLSRFWDFRQSYHVTSVEIFDKILQLAEIEDTSDLPLQSIISTLMVLDQSYLQSIKLSSLGNDFPREILGTIFDFEVSTVELELEAVDQRRSAREILTNSAAFTTLSLLEDLLSRLQSNIQSKFDRLYENLIDNIGNSIKLAVIIVIIAFLTFSFFLFISFKFKSKAVLIHGKKFAFYFGLVLILILISLFLIRIFVKNHREEINQSFSSIKNSRKVSNLWFDYMFLVKRFVTHNSRAHISEFITVRSKLLTFIDSLPPNIARNFEELDFYHSAIVALMASTLSPVPHEFIQPNITWNYDDLSLHYSDTSIYGPPRHPYVTDPGHNSIFDTSSRCWMTSSDLDFELIPSIKRQLSNCILTDRKYSELSFSISSYFYPLLEPSKVSILNSIYSKSFLIHISSICYFILFFIITYVLAFTSTFVINLIKRDQSNAIIPKKTVKCGNLSNKIINSMAGHVPYADVSQVSALKNHVIRSIIMLCLIVLISPVAITLISRLQVPVFTIHQGVVSSLRGSLVSKSIESLEAAAMPTISMDLLNKLGPRSSSGALTMAQNSLTFIDQLVTHHDGLIFGGKFSNYDLPPSVGMFKDADALTFGFPLETLISYPFVYVNNPIADVIFKEGLGSLLPVNTSADSVAFLPLKGTWFYRSVDVALRHFVDRVRSTGSTSTATHRVDIPEGLASLAHSLEGGILVSSAVFVQSVIDQAEASYTLALGLLLVQIVLILIVQFKGIRSITKAVNKIESSLHQVLLLLPSEVVTTVKSIADELT